MIVLLVLSWLPATSAVAQEGDYRLELSNLNTADFPDISFQVSVTDQSNNAVGDLSGLRVLEDGEPAESFTVEEIRTGLELVFVIDANRTIEQRDEAGGLNRREKVRDSIIDFARRYMDPQLQDRVSIVVPAGDGGRFLEKAGMTFTNEVINAINFYETGTPGDTPLQEMLDLALEQTRIGRTEGRFPAIVLFSDGAELDQQLNFSRLVSEAEESGTTIYGVILGSRADQGEIANVTRLSEPSGGDYIHMPESNLAGPLFETIYEHGFSHRVSYRSALNSAGPHTLSVALGNGLSEREIDLTVEPPEVRLAVDNSQPIRRVATSADALLKEIEPKEQPMVAQVTWPDGHPRELISSSLLVDGIEWQLDEIIFSDDGLLTFDWNISSLGDGVYQLEVQVVDELALVSTSPPLPLTIEVERPSPPAQEIAPTQTAVPVQVEEPATVEEPAVEGTNTVLLLVGALILVLLGLLALMAIVFLLRRRKPAAQPSSPRGASPAVVGPSSGDPGDTIIMQPGFAADQDTAAYLEALENAPEHPGLIPLDGNNVALGRDPRRVQVPFKDRSVSRLHARIMRSHGAYLLYDEGSSSGTYVNYKRVGLSPHQLKDSDDVHLGRVRVRFRLARTLRDEGRL